MYLVNNFGTLVLLSSLLALCLIPGIIPPLASADEKFPCAEINNPQQPENTDLFPSCASGSICHISVETGFAGGCQPSLPQQCPADTKLDGTIRCGPSGKLCCCGNPAEVCNNHTNPAIKDKICAVPELQASKLCCPQGGCTAGKSPGSGGGGARISAFLGLITGMVGIIIMAVL